MVKPTGVYRAEVRKDSGRIVLFAEYETDGIRYDGHVYTFVDWSEFLAIATGIAFESNPFETVSAFHITAY